jgi:hypothetical protein
MSCKKTYLVRCCCVPQNVLGVIKLGVPSYGDRPRRIQVLAKRARPEWFGDKRRMMEPTNAEMLHVERYQAPVDLIAAGLVELPADPTTARFAYWTELAVKSDDRSLDELSRIPGFRRIHWMREV